MWRSVLLSIAVVSAAAALLPGPSCAQPLVDEPENWEEALTAPPAFDLELAQPASQSKGQDRGRRSRLSLGAGVKLQSPLNPYVKAAYRYYAPLSEEVIARAQQTVFWENDEGLGTSLRAGVDWLLSGDRMLRWNNYLKLTQDTRGTYWNTNLTLYQRLGEIRAIALRGGVRGETGREYSPIEYQLEAIYRQPFRRDWLFLEVRGGGGWLRTREAESRDFVPRVAVVFEMVFGRHPMLEYVDDEAPAPRQ